jgi:multiple sugar transport system ATP-binding protein
MNVIPAPVLKLGSDASLVGFRPEHIRVGSAQNGSVGFEAGVEVVEYLGDEKLAHLRLGELSLVAKLPVAERVEPGTAAAFAVSREALLFFAADTGFLADPPA